jgi:hypothetical protein
MKGVGNIKAGPVLFGAVFVAIIVFFYWLLGHK